MMRLLLAIGLISITLGCAADAKQLRATGTQLFCVKEEDLLMYVVTRTTSEFKDRQIPGCMVLKKGVRYTVLDDSLTARGQRRAVKVRIKQRKGAATEGYLMSAGE